MKMIKKLTHGLFGVCFLLLLWSSLAVPQVPARAAQNGGDYVFLVREIELAELGLDGPAGLAYSRKADLLLSLSGQPKQPGKVISMINRIELQQGQSELDAAPPDPLDMAFNQRFNSLFLLNPSGQELLQVNADENGKLPSRAPVSKRHDLNGLGIQQAQGMSFDMEDGRLFFIDPAGKRLYIIAPNDAGEYDVPKANSEGRVTRVDLKGLGENHLRGLAFNPRSGNLFTVGPDSQMLYEVSQSGDLVASRDISSFQIKDPQNLVFAPSGDSTDEPEIESLYLADPARKFIVEISITPFSEEAQALALPEASASAISLINTIQSSSWNPPSPDPSGIDYFPSKNGLMVADSEVDEMTIFQNKNVYETSFGGSLRSTCLTTAFSREPTGLAVNPNNGHIFFSDDNKKRVFEVNLGGDGNYCTGDDTVTSFDTLTHNISDPEGITFGSGRLIVADGLNKEIYVISPGSNGRFDGGPPAGDDQSSHFDTWVMGLRDPEGVGFHPVNETVIIVSRGDKLLVEATLSGSVRRTFDITFLNAVGPAGVGVAPGSQNNQARNVYLSARGVDNNNDPNENDGKIYELDLGDRVGTPDPTPTPTNVPSGPVNLYLSITTTTTSGVGNLARVDDEDIIQFDGTNFSMVFDGSDVGVGSDIDAFDFLDADSLLFSLTGAVTVPGVGTVDVGDVVRFDASSLGANTAGTFSLYFDGSDVDLTLSAENIDAIDLLPDGRLLLSTSGNGTVGTLNFNDEDLIAFTPTSLGADTSGTWAMYFDGSDVALNTNSGEDIFGASHSSDGNIYLATRGPFAVSNVSGTQVDVFICRPTSLGSTTACSFSSSLYFTGGSWGLSGNGIDGLVVP